MDRNGEKRSCCRLHWCTNKRQSGICGTHNEPPAAVVTSNNEKESVGKENGKRNGIRGSAGGTGLVSIALRVAARARICVHAFRRRRGPAANRRTCARRAAGVSAGLRDWLFSGFHQFWRIGKRGGNFFTEPPQYAGTAGRRINSALWIAPDWMARENHHPRRAGDWKRATRERNCNGVCRVRRIR